MSFITDPTGSIYQTKVNWRERPAIRTVNQWIAAEDMNQVRAALLDLREVVMSSSAVIEAHGGLVLNPGLAEAGPGNDPSGSLASGSWTILSASSRLEPVEMHNMSASVSEGRLYVLTDGTYWIHASISMEAVSNPQNWNGHIAIFITGTQNGKWSQAMDFVRDASTMYGVDALVYLTSGSYFDARIRPSADISTFVTHHFQFLAHKV